MIIESRLPEPAAGSGSTGGGGTNPRRYEAGETFEIPAGTPHQMSGDGPARVNWQVAPAMRTAEFFERLRAAIDAGGEEVPAVLEEFAPEIQFSAV